MLVRVHHQPGWGYFGTQESPDGRKDVPESDWAV